MSAIYTQTEAAVLAPLLLTTCVHTAVVIEGIERRARAFGRAVPLETEIRAAIDRLIERGHIGVDQDGYLFHIPPTPEDQTP